MPGSKPGEQAAGTRARRRLRAVSAVTFFVLAVVSVAAALFTSDVIRNQERLILRERTGEAAAVLGSAFSGTQASLRLLGTLAQSGRQGRTALFAAAARSVTTSASQAWLVTAQQGPRTTVIAAAGRGPAVGAVLSGGQERLARRALAVTGMVTGLFRQGPVRWLALGIGRAAGPGTVVWEEAKLSQRATVRVKASSPFGNLAIAIYASARPSPATLLVTTSSRPPLAGLHYPFRVGADTWLIMAESTHPIVGALAEAMPWIILAIGVLGAMLVTAVVETLGRRRDYAAALVAERTASLHTAIADLEQAQAQLIRQERLAAVGQLASTVGHELRNPLGVVMNVLYLMEAAAGEAPDGPVRRHIATAKREISAATLIVSDLLDYSAGRQPILAPVKVSELVTEALSVAPPPNGVRVVQDGEPQVTIDADHDQIRQALLNLITNGYDAMPGGGTLTIAAESAPDWVRITVTDTGSGMDEETCEAIFTPFYTKKARGIGLGLAVTKRIIEAHHGTITVRSTPSAGSSFTITVPAAAALASVAQ